MKKKIIIVIAVAIVVMIGIIAIASVNGLFVSTTKQGYRSPEGDYYVLNDDKSWSHYNATGDVIEDRITEEEKVKDINVRIKNRTLVMIEITDGVPISNAENVKMPLYCEEFIC